MFPLKRWLAVIHVLSIWTIGYARGCGDLRILIGKQCCDLCPPGEYVKEFCTEHKQTVCSPCERGSFSNEYTMFDRCQECQSCKHEYLEKCTPTTNAKCSCPSGFLCSDNVCSTCEEKKCFAGERLNRTAVSTGVGLIRYSYQCEPACPGNAYFDAKEEICKPWTQCSAIGLAELFPGNKTHNSVCDLHAVIHSNGGNSSHEILSIGFVLLSLSLLVFLSSACAKNLRNYKANGNPILVAPANDSDFHLSKEECGLQLRIQDEYKDSNSYGKLPLGKVTTH
ncbi:tumor necrosis factor receptor superfamily member 18 [Xiphias gladius]|uniref:tumor necrosis factor receptor superfamily member 18 n=1 Tax=Xiphias gladius TaxID=8245 RepID=UPI001A99C725|nr:tumor necrosis factor receptor superfamily member 18 [Xiphias gladius]